MNNSKMIKKFKILSFSCAFSIALLTGCNSSNKSDSTPKTPEQTKNSSLDSNTASAPQTSRQKNIYAIKSYNVYDANDTLDYYYNFDYTKNVLTKIEGFDKEGLGIKYKTELDTNDNLISFSSFNPNGAKSEYYKMTLFDDGTLKSEYRYSSTDDVLYKYDYTYNDDKKLDTKTGYSTGKTQSSKAGYTYNKKGYIVQQTNYSIKGDATSYIKYFYKKGKLNVEKYISKDDKVYYINRYKCNKRGLPDTIKSYSDKKCKKLISVTKIKYNKHNLKTDEFHYNKRNKLEKHIKIKYTKIKAYNENPWYLDWIYNHICI